MRVELPYSNRHVESAPALAAGNAMIFKPSDKNALLNGS